jgi:NADH:ubiquinone oxidoreductase subunit E
MSEHKQIDFKTLHYAGQEGRLIPLLQQAQAQDGFLSRERLMGISTETGVPLAQIYGVATFYAQFRFQPVGKHICRVCHGTACHVAGAKGISEALESQLGIKDGETTADREFTLETVSCIGCCSLAPVIMIDGTTYGNLAPNDIKKVLKQHRQASEEVVKK